MDETPQELIERIERGIEQASSNANVAADADAEIVRRDAGVRLRTNVQAGSASERVNVTLETRAQDLAGLVMRLDGHRSIIANELNEAHATARRINRGDDE